MMERERVQGVCSTYLRWRSWRRLHNNMRDNRGSVAVVASGWELVVEPSVTSGGGGWGANVGVIGMADDVSTVWYNLVVVWGWWLVVSGDGVLVVMGVVVENIVWCVVLSAICYILQRLVMKFHDHQVTFSLQE
ncbi:hypothetical protein HanRHA438_Chr04g0156601 [Helianthus annuus]|uniref:Transmembrane protein n=1 Tax=Helianthus annuus TaxID=4232 RepID=A0A9K3J4K1_HELAN|nr:hypothetical protein HanXRQr2_Chr04g0146461 [Helianthus annuus]KAJ0586959.1 hypothetical protein HanIR_Chr04g0157701 [Helianthus annuus]KAJ0925172.1 hypothetical protein HanRHA438_Chr04g0156601 [Helianthus annuus]KAJ0929752.1 hypothetical protein HanPSC8_Chr04g0141251 [Helianthus annuus]